MIFHYLGALVLATYISASAALPPCVCTRDLKPVCGTDGTTYNNECLLDCARTRGKSDLAVERRGKCEFPGIQADPNSCICTLENLPVCGSDGKTYPNGCAMDCQARARSLELVKVHDGECRQKRDVTLPDQPCICTMDYRPVCASDGNSYPNRCAMDCQARARSLKLVKVHDGECRQKRDIDLPDQSCICTLEYIPVCASDGNSYPNRCAMDCQARARSLKLVKVHDGECRKKRDITLPDQPCICTLEYLPVCASDGNSYPNRCAMDCQARARSLKLVKVHDGECRQKRDITLPDQPCICTLEYLPVCASDGNSYPNRCAMDCQARARSLELVKVHDGECRQKRDITLPDQPCICTLEYLPVCASDGNSYPNRCAMDCQARARSLELVKVHDGECRQKRDTVKVAELKRCVCTKEKKPVCGTDGHTYANPCILRCAKQAKADLDIQHGGSCENVEESVVPEIPKKPASCTCSRDLEPVCATNGVTYPNECLMKCAGAQLDRQGPCDGVTQQFTVDENSS